MTKTYLIQAWCIRPFITAFDVTAETPEQAIAIARNRQEKLLDAAEECSGDYPWDEFAAFDENGQVLLHVLDDEARLRNAATELLAALQWLVDDLADAEEDRNPVTGEEYDSVVHARAALAKARGRE